MTNTQQQAATHLVNILAIMPDVVLDIHYATPNNFMGFVLYSKPLCYLHKDVAQALYKVQNDLKKLSLALKIFDGYRPLSVQQAMWDAIQDVRFVSNPAITQGSHTRGAAVDVTLIDEQGRELEMSSAFDEFNETAASNYMGASPMAIKNRKILQAAMLKHGFSLIETEWWHFNFENWNDNNCYPPLDITFEELENLHN